jgi:hypothetical protein
MIRLRVDDEEVGMNSDEEPTPGARNQADG